MEARRRPLVVLGRIGYRVANLAIALDRRARPSQGRGVKFIVEMGDGRILLVRHTYGNRHWTLPGGRVGRNEEPAAAAAREMDEELGLRGLDLASLGSYPWTARRRRESVSVFAARCGDLDPVANPIEIGAAGWFSPSDLPDELDPGVAPALALLAEWHARSAREALSDGG